MFGLPLIVRRNKKATKRTKNMTNRKTHKPKKHKQKLIQNINRFQPNNAIIRQHAATILGKTNDKKKWNNTNKPKHTKTEQTNIT